MYVHYIYGTIYLITVLLTISGNGMAVFVFLTNKKMQLPYSIYVLALCFCDLLAGLFGTSLVAFTSFTGGWIYGVVGCTFHGTVMTFLGLTQISLLTALAVYRCLCVVTHKFKQKLTIKSSVSVSLLCYLYGLLWSLGPAVFGWSSFELSPLRTWCAPNWRGITIADKTYSIALMLLCFVIPVAVITVSYTFILRKVSLT